MDSNKRKKGNKNFELDLAMDENVDEEAKQQMYDLIVDKVSLKKYKCCKSTCRKTFDNALTLFEHVQSHVSLFFCCLCQPLCENHFRNFTRNT